MLNLICFIYKSWYINTSFRMALTLKSQHSGKTTSVKIPIKDGKSRLSFLEAFIYDDEKPRSIKLLLNFSTKEMKQVRKWLNHYDHFTLIIRQTDSFTRIYENKSFTSVVRQLTKKNDFLEFLRPFPFSNYEKHLIKIVKKDKPLEIIKTMSEYVIFHSNESIDPNLLNKSPFINQWIAVLRGGNQSIILHMMETTDILQHCKQNIKYFNYYTHSLGITLEYYEFILYYLSENCEDHDFILQMIEKFLSLEENPFEENPELRREMYFALCSLSRKQDISEVRYWFNEYNVQFGIMHDKEIKFSRCVSLSTIPVLDYYIGIFRYTNEDFAFLLSDALLIEKTSMINHIYYKYISESNEIEEILYNVLKSLLNSSSYNVYESNILECFEWVMKQFPIDLTKEQDELFGLSLRKGCDSVRDYIWEWYIIKNKIPSIDVESLNTYLGNLNINQIKWIYSIYSPIWTTISYVSYYNVEDDSSHDVWVFVKDTFRIVYEDEITDEENLHNHDFDIDPNEYAMENFY